MRYTTVATLSSLLALTLIDTSFASTASQREYKRGYADCSAGRYDQEQYGASYKKGCRAAEAKSGSVASSTAGATAAASSSDAMLDKCRARAAAAFKASPDVVNVKYEGQRTDGTHAVNGSVEGSAPATFQCSFNRSGSRIVKFTRAVAAGGTAHEAAGASDVSSEDKQACLRAVKKQTNNPTVVVLGSEISQANNSVTLGGGPQRAPWRCLVKGGSVSDVTSLTEEGKL